MAKFTPKLKASPKAKYLREPFKIGREGAEFLPKTFAEAEARGSEAKSVPTKSKL